MSTQPELNRQAFTDVKELEELYSHRNLQFTSPFDGLEPVQAYGHLDGMRFYYRLRGRTAGLKVGIYDKLEEQFRWRKQKEWLRKIFPHVNVESIVILPTENDPELYPTKVLMESTTTDINKPQKEIFIQLVENLRLKDLG